jgi:hypothetical protein
MERTSWTDERLDDFAQKVDAGLGRVEADIRELRTEVRAGFEEVHRRLDAQGAELRGAIDSQGSGLRGEIDSQGSELRAEIYSLRQTILRVGGGMMVGLLGVIAAVLARGA